MRPPVAVLCTQYVNSPILNSVLFTPVLGSRV